MNHRILHQHICAAYLRCSNCIPSMFSNPTAKSFNPNHIQYLKPLFVVSRCFGVTLTDHHPVCTLYSAILAVLVFAAYFEIFILKIMFSPDFTRNLFFGFMDTLCEVFLVLSDVSTIIDTTILKRELTGTFMTLLMKNDRNRYSKRRQKIFLGEFICVMFCTVVYHAYHLHTFAFRVLTVFVRYIFFREISVYLTAINLLQLYNFVLIIRNKFAFLNRSLRKSIAAGHKNPFFNIDRHLTEYVEYCELVHLFNKLFGSRIFWVMGFVVIATVEGFQIVLNCFAHVRLHRLGDDSCQFVGAATLAELTIYAVRIHKCLRAILYCLLFLQMLWLMFIAVCDQSCRQAEITKDLCYKLLLARSFSGRDVERKLCILMEQFESHKPVFTASGFFNINYSIITAVWTYMVSNLIISLTFKGE